MAGVLRIGAGPLPATAGGKALGLAEIARAGLDVPAAWAVLPGASAGELAELGNELRRRGIARVAVRSSAGDEDGARHSFAGIHETELGVPVERLREAIARVASSPLSERASAYRRQHGLPAAAGPCAVIVQEMVEAEWAGVAFGKDDGVLVEAVEGLGEVAVNGDATPELLELSRAGGGFRVARRWPRRQPFAVRATSAGTAREPLVRPLAELPEEASVALAAGVAALERARGRPLDVEWALRRGELAWLQARAQTRPLEAALAPGEAWTRTNVSDTFPEIVSALARDGAVGALDRLMRWTHARLGVSIPSGIPLGAAVAGRIVFNERSFFEIGDLVGVPREWLQILQGGAVAGRNGYVFPDFLKLLRRLDVVLRMARWGRGAAQAAEAHVVALKARHATRAAVPVEGRTDEELAATIVGAWSGENDETLHFVMRVATAFQQVVSAGAMVVPRHPAPAALLGRLVDPDQASVSTRQLEEMLALARGLRRWEGAAPFFAEVRPEHADRAQWAAALPASLWADAERWLAAYGHRCPNESDLAVPRVAEDLRLLAAALRPFVLASAEPERTEARRHRRREDHAAAWREVPSALARLRLRGPIRDMGRLMLVREELRSAMMLRHQWVRRDALELARRLVRAGRLDAADELFNLTPDEVLRAVREPGFDARGAVARERARIAAWRRLEVPNRFTSEEAAALGRAGVAVRGGDAVLRGTAVSPGVVEGRACVLRTPDDEAKMALGGVLVTHATDPGWTPLFARAAAVVVELGGVMSHSATVAREYGLPCVSNVDGAVAKLRDGDLLRVDGTHGTVEVLERA